MSNIQFFTQSKFIIKQAKLFYFLIVVTFMLSGCPHNDWTIDLPPLAATTGLAGGDDRILVIPKIVDKRKDKKRSGTKVGLGNVYPNKDVASWLTSRLREELGMAGFRVLTESSNASATRVNGYLEVFFTELVRQWSTMDYETDIALRILVKRNDGLEAEKKYYIKGVELGQALSAGHYVVAQKKGTDALMKKIVADLINLLNRYPEQHDFSQQGFPP